MVYSLSYFPLPSGTVLPYAGSSAPSGWLLCDGSAVSRTTYARLFAVIGTTFGAGDGSTTFNLPDTRGRSVLGAGSGTGLTSRALGATGGAETHTLTEDEMPSHTHTQDAHTHTQNAHTHTDSGHTHGIGSYVAAQEATSHNHTFTTGVESATHTHSGMINNTGGGSQVVIGAGYAVNAVTSSTQSANHVHSGTTDTGGTVAHTHTLSGTSGSGTASLGNTTATNQNATATNQDTGGDDPHNNMHPFLVLNHIIKA